MSCATYIVLGSGGHTAEMCQILKALLLSKTKNRYLPLRFVLAKSDNTSAEKVLATFEDLGMTEDDMDEDIFVQIPRAREVGQSWLTTVFTTLWAIMWSFWLVWRDKPRLVLCNGPGTCFPLAIAAYFWRCLGRLPGKSKIVFVESFCRVRTLSLCGKLLLPFLDALVVQWAPLAEAYRHKSNVKYFGRLM